MQRQSWQLSTEFVDRYAPSYLLKSRINMKRIKDIYLISKKASSHSGIEFETEVFVQVQNRDLFSIYSN